MWQPTISVDTDGSVCGGRIYFVLSRLFAVDSLLNKGLNIFRSECCGIKSGFGGRSDSRFFLTRERASCSVHWLRYEDGVT